MSGPGDILGTSGAGVPAGGVTREMAFEARVRELMAQGVPADEASVQAVREEAAAAPAPVVSVTGPSGIRVHETPPAPPVNELEARVQTVGTAPFVDDSGINAELEARLEALQALDAQRDAQRVPTEVRGQDGSVTGVRAAVRPADPLGIPAEVRGADGSVTGMRLSVRPSSPLDDFRARLGRWLDGAPEEAAQEPGSARTVSGRESLQARRRPRGGGGGGLGRQIRAAGQAVAGAKQRADEERADVTSGLRSAAVDADMAREELRGITEQEVAAAEANAGELAEQRQQLEGVLDAQQQAQDESLSRIEEASKALREYEVRDRRGTAQRVADAIAVAGGEIGAFLQTYATGIKHRNAIADQVQRDIDRDMERQRLELGKLDRGLRAEQNRATTVAQGFRDRAAGLNMVEASMLREHQAEMERFAAQMRGTKAQADIQQGANELGLRAEELEMQAAEREQQQAMAALQQMRVQRAKIQAAQAKRPQVGDRVSRSAVVVDPGVFQQLGKKEKSDARAAAAALSKFKRVAAKLIALRKEHGAEVLPTEAASQMDSLRAQLITQARTIEQTGVPQSFELERFEARLPGSEVTMNAVAKLEAEIDGLESSTRAGLQEYGVDIEGAMSADTDEPL